jgi:hypothetical protein
MDKENSLEHRSFNISSVEASIVIHRCARVRAFRVYLTDPQTNNQIRQFKAKMHQSHRAKILIISRPPKEPNKEPNKVSTGLPRTSVRERDGDPGDGPDAPQALGDLQLGYQRDGGFLEPNPGVPGPDQRDRVIRGRGTTPDGRQVAPGIGNPLAHPTPRRRERSLGAPSLPPPTWQRPVPIANLFIHRFIYLLHRELQRALSDYRKRSLGDISGAATAIINEARANYSGLYLYIFILKICIAKIMYRGVADFP